jgi:hypothetical protein
MQKEMDDNDFPGNCLILEKSRGNTGSPSLPRIVMKRGEHFCAPHGIFLLTTGRDVFAAWQQAGNRDTGEL